MSILPSLLCSRNRVFDGSRVQEQIASPDIGWVVH